MYSDSRSKRPRSNGLRAALSTPRAMFARLVAAARARPRTAMTIGLLALWVPLVVKAIRNALEEGGNDFTILYRAGTHLLAGEPIYDGYYVYPPPFAVAMALLATLPYSAAAVVWAIAKVPLVLHAASVFTRSMPAGWSRFWIVVGPALLYRSFESDLVTGNSNVFLLAGVAFAVDLEGRGALRRVAGVPLGLVAAVKLSPTYLLVAAAASRRFVVCGIGVATLIGAVALSSLVVADGSDGTRTGFFGTSTTVFEADEVNLEEGRTGYLPGQSARSLVHRLTRPIDATAHDRGRFVAIHWFDVGRAPVAEWIYRGIAIACGLLALIWIARRRVSFPWAIALGACVLLWISPYSRKAHFVLLLPAVLLAIQELHISAAARARSTIALLSAAVLLGPLTSKGLWGREISAWLVAHCPFGIASVLVAIVVVQVAPTEPENEAID